MVFNFLGLGKKAPKMKLEPRQEVEVEVVGPDSAESFFAKVVAVERKKLVVIRPPKLSVALHPGDSVVVTYLENDLTAVSSFESKIGDVKEREFEMALPTNIVEEKTPMADPDFSIDIPIPVEYRAMSTAYLQTATTRTITQAGINILTNLAIPPNTSLHIELQIPNAPTVKTQGRVASSKKLPTEKKHITEIEFEDITAADKDIIYRYALFYQQRQLRKQLRGGDV